MEKYETLIASVIIIHRNAHLTEIYLVVLVKHEI